MFDLLRVDNSIPRRRTANVGGKKDSRDDGTGEAGGQVFKVSEKDEESYSKTVGTGRAFQMP